MVQIDSKFLREYRCPICNKLLAKGYLTQKEDYLEIKCRGCKSICLVSGEHAEILAMRAKLFKKGLIPNTE